MDVDGGYTRFVTKISGAEPTVPLAWTAVGDMREVSGILGHRRVVQRRSEGASSVVAEPGVSLAQEGDDVR